jgi:hypothetical protein
MRSCMQFGDMDVLEHGLAVTRAFSRLWLALEAGEIPEGWRVPSWLLAEPVRTRIMAQCAAPDVLYAYQKYHDCGKPFCRVVDEEGRTHFPDHAEVSAQVWRDCGGSENVGRLIRLDMAMHLASAEEMKELVLLPEASSLFLTALAEVHANAEMFGGLDSTSFKAKAKHLDRRGKQLR